MCFNKIKTLQHWLRIQISNTILKSSMWQHQKTRVFITKSPALKNKWLYHGDPNVVNLASIIDFSPNNSLDIVRLLATRKIRHKIVAISNHNVVHNRWTEFSCLPVLARIRFWTLSLRFWPRISYLTIKYKWCSSSTKVIPSSYNSLCLE